MVIRARADKDGLVVHVYANEKGAKTPLASRNFGKQLSEITGPELTLAIETLRVEAAEKYGRQRGLARYTVDGGS